ncbi:MAG: phosphodiester glycosidase family protein [Actinomycetota bacterium]
MVYEAPIAAGLVLTAVAVAVLAALWRWRERLILPRLLGLGVLPVLLAGLGVLGWGLFVAAGPRSDRTEQLASMVTYEQLWVADGGRGHLATIDLGDPCTRLITTAIDAEGRVGAQQTENWAADQAAVVAMNASFFAIVEEAQPPSVGLPLLQPSRYQEGLEAGVLGQAVVDGELRGLPRDWQGDWDGVLVHLDAEGRPGVGWVYPEDAVWGVGGRALLLDDGVVTAPESVPYARSIIGFNDTTMWWLVVDGKQAGYSHGVTLTEAATFLADRGATHAIEFDGGGSAILATADDVLSRPVHRRIPGRSRPVANHVGVIDGCAPAVGTASS